MLKEEGGSEERGAAVFMWVSFYLVDNVSTIPGYYTGGHLMLELINVGMLIKAACRGSAYLRIQCRSIPGGFLLTLFYISAAPHSVGKLQGYEYRKILL